MYAKLFILMCALAAVLAYPYEDVYAVDAEEAPPVSEYADFNGYVQGEELARVRRQVEVQAQGGGSRGQGLDIMAQVHAPVWTSDNGRHTVAADLGYAQHLGGPYGNSRPQFQPGASYTFRF